MEERMYRNNGAIWILQSVPSGYKLTRIVTNLSADFPISEICFSMDQLMRNDDMTERPPFNAKHGGHITHYHPNGADVLELLRDLSLSDEVSSEI